MSLSDPAREKDTEDEIDKVDTTQIKSALSPRSNPMSVRMDAMTRKPHERGATEERPRNWF